MSFQARSPFPRLRAFPMANKLLACLSVEYFERQDHDTNPLGHFGRSEIRP